MYTIASVSFGKDSLAMLLLMLKLGMHIDEVMFYDTGMEFDAIYRIRDMVKVLLEKHGILYTELKPEMPFEYLMFEKPVQGRLNGFHYGYSWCGGRCRWGTTEKLRAMDRYAQEKNAQVYVGIAADEVKRLDKERADFKHFPLAKLGYTEAECLALCYQHGIYWLEDGVRLYDILDRVSCWCCSNKNLKELENIYLYLPRYWNKLKTLQARTDRPMKGEGKSIFELEERFSRKLMAAGAKPAA